MRWTCPKCGKKLEVSNEQLIANDGIIVCPQCLLQAHLPLPKARIRAREDEPATPVPKRQTASISFDTADTPPEYKPSNTTPPPHKTRMKQASTSYRYTGLGGDSATPKKPTAKKKSKKKKKQNGGMSPLGCMGRTIVFTLILFAAYVFFGLLIDALQ